MNITDVKIRSVAKEFDQLDQQLANLHSRLILAKISKIKINIFYVQTLPINSQIYSVT